MPKNRVSQKLPESWAAVSGNELDMVNERPRRSVDGGNWEVIQWSLATSRHVYSCAYDKVPWTRILCSLPCNFY
jgi:hypothetical protein